VAGDAPPTRHNRTMSKFSPKDPALRKYVLLQVPEALLAALGISALLFLEWIDGPVAVVLGVAWLVKDVVLYPIVRPAYEEGPPHGTEALVGARGVVADRLEPAGRVRVGAELWNAVAAREGVAIEVGEPVVIERVDGYTVVVTRD